MPATFPSHLAAVLPLKVWRPAWFDGVALVIGSMTPDLAYALDGCWLEQPVPGLPPLWKLAHSLPWFAVWTLPVAFALCPLIRRYAPTVAFHLPAPLSGYSRIGRSPRWYITAFSAVIGAASHVLWDRFAVGPVDLISTFLGGLLALWLLLRHPRLLHARKPSAASPLARNATAAVDVSTVDDGRANVGTRRPAVFWCAAIAVLVPGAALLPLLPGYFLAHTTSARAILLGTAALLAAAVATRLSPVRREPFQQ